MFFSIFRRTRSKPTHDELVEAAIASPAAPYPLVPVEYILEHPRSVALIQDIKRAYSESAAVYAANIGLPIVAYAHFCHLLPASKEHHHSGPLGLFWHGLEVGLLMLRQTHDFTPFLPSPLPRDSAIPDCQTYGRALIFIVGMCHDAGKIDPSYMEICLIDPDTGQSVVCGAYTPHLGGRYSQTLYEFAKEKFGSRASRMHYRIRFRQRRFAAGHEADGLEVADRILTRSAVAVPDLVRKHYLDPTSTVFRSKIKPLLEWADSKSTLDDALNIPPAQDAICRSISEVLEYWAREGHLKNLAIIGPNRFLPQRDVIDLLPTLPMHEAFACSSRTPNQFINQMKLFGFCDTREGDGIEESDNIRMIRVNGVDGVLLAPRTVADILYWENHHPAPDDAMESAADEQTANNSEQAAASESTPAPAADTVVNNRSTDISSCGVSVLPPPEETPAPVANSSSANFDKQLPRGLEALRHHLMMEDPVNFSDTDKYDLVDDRLIMCRKYFRDLLPLAGVTDPDDNEEIFHLSEKYASQFWVMRGDPRLVSELHLTKAFTSFLLSGLQSPIEFPPPIKRREAPTDEPESVVIAASSKPTVLSTEGLLRHLRHVNSSRPKPPFGEFGVRIPVSDADSYLGDTSGRGDLTRALRNDGALVRRTTKSYWLDPNHKEVLAWLNESPKTK